MNNNNSNLGKILPISTSEKTAIKGGSHHQDSPFTEVSFATAAGDLVDIQIGEGFVSVTSSSSDSTADLDTEISDSSTSILSCGV